MIIMCNEEGVSALRAMASAIDEGIDEITSACGTLKDEVSSMQGIGPDTHVQQLASCIESLEEAIKNAAEPAKTVAERLNQKAGEYQAWIGSTAYTVSGN